MTTTASKLDTSALIDALADWDLTPETTAALRSLDHGDTLPALLDNDGDDPTRYGLSWADVAEETWDDDMGEHIHRFGPRLYLHDSAGNSSTMVFAADSIRDFLAGWDWDSYGSHEKLLVAFGLDPEIPVAEPDHAGPVRVWCSPNYYPSTCNAPAPHWITEDPDDASSPIQTFETYAAAAEWIRETEDSARAYRSETNPGGSYVLAHGESSPPDYIISPA